MLVAQKGEGIHDLIGVDENMNLSTELFKSGGCFFLKHLDDFFYCIIHKFTPLPVPPVDDGLRMVRLSFYQIRKLLAFDFLE